jgi:site-specific DNA-cytosine methylase
MRKTILDLCGGTGSWSNPYKEAGYDVRLVTTPEIDVRSYEPPEDVYGILAAPPCTHFTVSGAQYWKEKDADGRTFEDITILTACLMIIARTQPRFWVIENPIGRMRNMLGEPDFKFDP